MLVIQKMDAAINLMQSQGHEVIEIDLTAEDYAALALFVADFDYDALEQMRLDLKEPTYQGHPIVINSFVPISGIVIEDGAEGFPTDFLTERHTRISA